jgi:ribosomal protein S18 acetylase RimI-like enzyme
MIRLHEFTFDDYDAVYALWHNAGPGIGLGRSDTREEIAKKLQRDPDLFLVATDADNPSTLRQSSGQASLRIIGTVIGGYDGRRGVIYHLAVEQSYREQGIGKMLMGEVERRLVAKGCLRCYLLVKDDALDVIEFYRRLGWDAFGTTVLAKTIE